jgi:hypothetical protein
MSESKGRSNFPLWRSGMAKMQSQIFHTRGPVPHTVRPDLLSLFPHIHSGLGLRDSGSSIIDQRLGSSSASDNAFFPTHFAFFPHTLRFPVTRHLSPAQTLATLFLASRSNPLPLTNPSFHLPLGGSSAYVLCSL